MTTALERLCERGVLDRRREPCPLTRSAWRYTPALTRQALLIQAVEQLCGTLGISNVERQQMAAVVRHGSQGVW